MVTSFPSSRQGGLPPRLARLGDDLLLRLQSAVCLLRNFDISWQLRGTLAPPERLAAMMLELQDYGCHNINLVTPEHVVPQIIEALPAAIEKGLRLPLVYNTSAYDSRESLELLDGIVDIYMPDFKYWDSEMARKLPTGARSSAGGAAGDQGNVSAGG